MAIETSNLIRAVCDMRGAGKRLEKLASRYTEEKNTNGLALLNHVLGVLDSAGVRQWNGYLERKCVRVEEAEKNKRVGKADVSGQSLRWMYVLDLRAYDKDGSLAKAAGVGGGKGPIGEVGEVKVGADHLDTLDDIISTGFKPPKTASHGRSYKDNGDMDDFFDKVTGCPGLMKNYRTLLDCTRGKLRETGMVRQTLLDPNAFNSDLSWVESHLGDLPSEIKAAYVNAKGVPDQEDFARIMAAVFQWKREPSEGLIGLLRKDIAYLGKLDEDADAFNHIERPDLDQEIESLALVKGATTVKRTLRAWLDQAVMSRAEALAVYRALPGYVEVRKEINKEEANRFVDTRKFGEQYRTVSAIIHGERERVRAAHKSEEDVDYSLRKDEYKLLRDAVDLFETAHDTEETERDCLTRMLPLEEAPKVFEAIAKVYRKSAAGIPLDTKVALQEGCVLAPEELEKLAYLPAATGANDCGLDVRAMAARVGKTGAQLRALQSELRPMVGQGIIPASLEKALHCREKEMRDFRIYLSRAQPIDADTSKKLDYLISLVDQAGLSTPGRSAEDGKRELRSSKPKANLENFRGARFLFPSQKKVVDNIYDALKKHEGVDLSRLASWEAHKAELAGKDVYWQGLVTDDRPNPYKGGLPDFKEHDGIRRRDISGIFQALDAFRIDKEYSMMMGVVAKQLERVAPGFSERLREAASSNGYIVPVLADKVESTYNAIVNGVFPLHGYDVLDEKSWKLFDDKDLFAKPLNRRFKVEFKSSSNKPWMDVWNTFSANKNPEALRVPGVKWHWDESKNYSNNRLSMPFARRNELMDTLHKVAEYRNQHPACKVYVRVTPV